MSYVARSSEGKQILRKRPTITVTISPMLLDLIIELEEVSGWNRSRCVEEALKIGLPEILNKLRKAKMKKEEEEEKISDKNSLPERYMRKVLFDFEGGDWEEVMR